MMIVVTNKERSQEVRVKMTGESGLCGNKSLKICYVC